MKSHDVPGLRAPTHVPPDRVIDFDIARDPGLKTDIFERLRAVRDASPRVAYSTANGGEWLVFGREELQRVVADPETFSTSYLAGGRKAFIPLSLDPPEHAPWRHLLLKHFGPAQVKSLEPFVRGWAERLIRPLETKSACDFFEAVAEPMPVSVFMVLMGLPLERFEEFRRLVMTVLTPREPGDAAARRSEASAEIARALGELIAVRRQAPKDDLVSRLLCEEIEGRPITQAELMSISFLLFIAGLDTVTNAMAFGIRHLARDLELQEDIRQDRALIPATVEKLLRLYTFVNTSRLVMKDTELDGVRIRKGEMVSCVLWGGSNDPGGEAEGPRHMAFGGGHHICLGMYLARLELRVMYETWFDRIGRFTLAPDPAPAMRGGPVMNITRLLLNLEPRA
ncbi:MAG TPA: cytochrome P450 [Caulobacteraceae bacterium]|nr:cytochrome P450 [Caulobacteraceae bacterium]